MHNRVTFNINIKGVGKMPNKGKNKENLKEKPLDFILCITVFLLLALGIIMVLSASAPSSLSQIGRAHV